MQPRTAKIPVWTVSPFIARTILSLFDLLASSSDCVIMLLHVVNSPVSLGDYGFGVRIERFSSTIAFAPATLGGAFPPVLFANPTLVC